MRPQHLIAALFSAAVLVATPCLAASTTGQSTQTRKDNCDAQRKACYAGKTQTDGNGVRYVPPDAVSECEGAFRACMGQN